LSGGTSLPPAPRRSRIRKGVGNELVRADVVVLAAGGLGTPVILETSGIPASPTLFVDPVLCVAARWEGAGLERQLPMPFVSEQPTTFSRRISTG